MDFFTSMDISASALKAQRIRTNIISSNLANTNTTRTPEGGPYKRKEVILEAKPIPDTDSFENLLKSQLGENKLRSVDVLKIVDDPRPPKMVYDPSHPDANKDGYVSFPNINIMEEMVNLIAATRSYEANANAIESSKNMAVKALDIGR